MFVAFSPIFVAATKIIHNYNFIALLIKGRSKVYEKNPSRECALNFDKHFPENINSCWRLILD